MLLLPKPKRMLLGYRLRTYLTSITLGLVIVFSLHGSSAADTAQNTVSPALDITFGLIALLIAYLLQTDRDRRLRERRQRRSETKKDKGPPKWQQFLARGSARS